MDRRACVRSARFILFFYLTEYEKLSALAELQSECYSKLRWQFGTRSIDRLGRSLVVDQLWKEEESFTGGCNVEGTPLGASDGQK